MFPEEHADAGRELKFPQNGLSGPLAGGCGYEPHSEPMPADPTRTRHSDPLRVAIYTRFSSPLQRKTSTEDQERECRDAAEQNGWVVLDQYVFSDQARSGQVLAGRDQLDRLLKLAEQSPCPFDGILIDDTSRLGRNLSDTLPLSDRLQFAKVFLYFVTRRLDSRDINFRTLFIAYGQQDEQSSLQLADKVRRGQRGRVLNGLLCSGSAYGYEHVPIINATGRTQYGRSSTEGVDLRIRPDEKAVIVRIFEMYASGLGPRTIARRLNQEGVPSPLKGQKVRGGVWTGSNVKIILRNEKYHGVSVWHKTKIVRNPVKQRKEQHPRPESEWVRVEVPHWRIVSEELWDAVRKEMQKRSEGDWRKEGGLNKSEASRRYLFSGVLICAKCGGKLQISRRNTGDVRYGCINHREYSKCSNSLTIIQRLLEDQLLESLSRHIHDVNVRERLYSEYRGGIITASNDHAATTKAVAGNADELDARRTDLKKSAENLLDAMQGRGRNALLSERLDHLDSEISEIDAMLETLKEVAVEPLSEEAIRMLVDQKLAELEATLRGDPEIAKQRIPRFIETLTMTPVETPEGSRYEVTGDINVFAAGDSDDVLLAASFERSCKQYTSLSFPFKATLNPRVVPMKKVRGRRY